MKKIETIQALRFVACLLVLIDHCEMQETLTIGRFGVFIFFMISGFVMMLSTEKQNQKGILLKRYLRIAPEYYLMTTLAVVVGLWNPSLMKATDISIFNIVKSYLFLAVKGNSNIDNHILGVGWTVNIEMFFYVVFWIAIKLSHHYRGVIASVILSSLYIIGRMFEIDIAYTAYYLLYFVVGMMTYSIYKKIIIQKKIKVKKSISYVCGGLACSILCIICIINPKTKGTIFIGMLMTFIFCLVVIGMNEIKFPRTVISLGNISFSIYLTHVFVLKACIRLIHPLDNWSIVNVALMLLYFVPVLVVGALSYYFFEDKFTSFVSKVVMRTTERFKTYRND